MKKLMLATMLLLFCGTAHAACTGSSGTWACPSGASASDIQTAINSSSGATVITLAAGTYTWSSHIDMMANHSGVTIICATAPLTQGAATSSPCTVTVSSYFGISQINGASSGGSNTNLYRISGFQFKQPNYNGTLFWLEYSCSIYPSPCTGTMTKVRFDHNTVDQSGESVGLFFGDQNSYIQVYGVADSNIFKSTTANWSASAGNGSILQWIGGTNPTDPGSQLGTANNFFVETNLIDWGTGGNGMTDQGFGIIDSWGGAAIVARYNTSLDGLWTAHAVTHGGGPYNEEFYHNTIKVDANGDGSQDCYRCIHLQGANTAIFWDNIFVNYSGHSSDAIDLLSYRDYAFGAGGTPGGAGASIDGSFPACDGTQGEDGNRSPSGTWYGYPCWHQAGRSPNGQFVPTYAWNNTWQDATAFLSNGGFNMSNGFAGTVPPSCTPQPAGTCDYSYIHEVANRDYYEPVSASANSSTTSPFNGSTGMGFGTTANRPTNCTTSTETVYGNGAAGTAYFETDNGAQGALYTCVATNTWGLFYTPYTYPHPLVGGGGTGPETSYSPGLLDYGNVTVGTPSALTVTLTNPGDMTLTGTIALTVGIKYVITGGTCSTGSLSVAASGSCTVIVTFTPTSTSTFTDTLVFTTNAASSPDSINCTGTGAITPVIVAPTNLQILILQ